MFKACGLDSSALRIPSLPVRAVCAPRASRSFAHTVRVSRDGQAKFARSPSTLSQLRVPKPPAIEHNELEGLDPSSVQSIERAARLCKEDVQGNEVARDKLKEQWFDQQWLHLRESGYSECSQKIREPQEFHYHLHPALLKNIMRKKPLLRAMPVYDSTFDAVLSGRNLFIKAPGQYRALQYLLPVAHSMLKHRVGKHGRPSMPGGQGTARTTEVLVICPTWDDAKAVEVMGTRLLQNLGSGLKMAVLTISMNMRAVKHISKGHDVLISTPEVLLQWLALGQKKKILLKTLQGFKTLVIDGEAYSLSRSGFLEMLDGALKDIPRSREVQRVVISDKHNQTLAWHLFRMAQIGDYEFHREPRLEEVAALRESRQVEKNREQGRVDEARLCRSYQEEKGSQPQRCSTLKRSTEDSDRK